MANNINQAVEEIALHFQTEIEDLKSDISEKIEGMSKRDKTRGIIWIVAGVVVLLLLIGIFFRDRTGPDTSAIDEKVALRDSVIKAKDALISQGEAQAAQLREDNINLQKQVEALGRAYISNQERHTVINQKINETPNAIRNISSVDSLRRAALGQ